MAQKEKPTKEEIKGTNDVYAENLGKKGDAAAPVKNEEAVEVNETEDLPQNIETEEIFVAGDVNIDQAFEDFEEAEKQEGVGISATGLKFEKEGDEKTLLFAKRGMVYSKKAEKEQECCFFFKKNREMVFSGSAGIVGPLKSTGTLEDGVKNYIKIKWLGKTKNDKGNDMNRYKVTIVNPPRVSQENRKQLNAHA